MCSREACKGCRRLPRLALAPLLLAGCAAFAQPAENLVDPTRPLGLPSVEEADAGEGIRAPALPERYELSSILVRPGLRVAVINSRQVSEGERIGEALVIAIERDSVTLEVGGQTRLMTIHGRSIKTVSGG